MARRVELTVSDIRDAIAKIRKTLADETAGTFARDDTKIAAVSMYVLVISEASRHVPDQVLAMHPEIPWSKIRAIGNLLRHVYFRTESEELWDIYKYDLEPLSAAIDDIADKLGSQR
jgi:uncharacterized protein with HEPN domain